MSGFTDVFGGSTLQAGQVAYAALSLSANLTTYWPAFCSGTQQPLARLLDVTPTAAGFAVSLPDATLAPLGQDVFFTNPGAYSYTVQDSAGNTVAVIAPGAQRYVYLTNNATSAGVWRSILMGVGASSPDASGLAGAGLKAVGSTLNQTSPTATISASTTFTTSDRAKTYVNVGGAITGTLPLSSATGNDFFMTLRNQGSGVLTVSPTGGELIDGSASITLQLNESCLIQAGVGAWYTVGRGRNTQFNFTQLLKTVTGGTTTLSLTEASNVVQTYSGAATSNNTIVLPAVVQVYYIANNVTGGYSFNLQSPTPGATLTIPYGQSAVVFSDGINVINASTSVGGISALLLAAGSAGAPSMAVGASNNGVFAPTSTSLAVSNNGSTTVLWSAGQELINVGTAGAPSWAFAGFTNTGMFCPGANQWAVSTNGTLRLSVDATGQINPGTDNTQSLGSAGLRFSDFRSVLATIGTLTVTNLTLSAALGVPAGGTGATSFTTASLLAGRGAAAISPATSAEIATALGTAAVTNAVNLNGSGSISDTTTINSIKVGYRDVPQLSQAPSTAITVADAGKHYFAASAGTWTIPANSAQAFPIGAALTFVNTTGSSCSIAITTDTLTMAFLGSTGTRTLANNGIATALKVGTTQWLISGNGLS